MMNQQITAPKLPAAPLLPGLQTSGQTNAPPTAPTATAFATWLQSHPAQVYLLATTDYASNHLLALETFPATKMPTVLAAAMAPAGTGNWAAIGPNAFKRVDFTPVVPVTAKQMATILALRDVVSARSGLSQEQQAVVREFDDLFSALLAKLPP